MVQARNCLNLAVLSICVAGCGSTKVAELHAQAPAFSFEAKGDYATIGRCMELTYRKRYARRTQHDSYLASGAHMIGKKLHRITLSNMHVGGLDVFYTMDITPGAAPLTTRVTVYSKKSVFGKSIAGREVIQKEVAACQQAA